MELSEAINQINEIRNNLLRPGGPYISQETVIFKQRSVKAIDIILNQLEKQEARQIILTQDEQEFLETLAKVENYPLDRKRDLELYKTLCSRYPEVNIIEAVKDWKIHKLEDPIKTGNNPRSQINTWVRNCVKWKKNLKKDNPTKPTGKYSDIYL